MVTEIKVPDLGESITEATVANWLAKPGDVVQADAPLLELETDKATLEVPAPASGVLSEILVPAGEDVGVGALLGRIDDAVGAGTKVSSGIEAGSAAETGAESSSVKSAPEAARGSKPEGAKAGEPGAGAKAEDAHRAGSAGPVPAPGVGSGAPVALDPSRVTRSGASGKVTLGDLLAFVGLGSAEALARSGPAVRKLVAERGLDPATLPATGPEGRITKEDVLAGEAVTAPEPAAADREHRVKMSRMRRTIAARLKDAQNTAAILTSFNECDMSRVIALRTEFKDAFQEKHGVKLGFMSFFVKAAVHALREVPEVNARIEDKEIVYFDRYDIGMAVSTPNGLVVPVIRDADRKTHAEIERTLADLAARARDGKLALDEMEGGTFSITNGGVFGSLVSTPILNLPQSGILGLHKIQDRPVAVEGKVEVRPMMYIALSYDHRLVDGREAVTFLVKVKEAIENPERPSLER